MKRLILIGAALLTLHTALAWGPKGHDVTAYIAENHLTPEAAEQIDKVLSGHSMVYYANWLDNASHTPQYAYTKTWHYRNVDEGKTVETMPKNPAGDVETAITEVVAKLKSKQLTAEEEFLNLKILVHLMGDMHTPMHLGRLTDLGGNLRPVIFFNRSTGLHSLWDSQMIDAAHKWSYSEWQEQIDRLNDDEIVVIQAGDPHDWIQETHALCEAIYKDSPEGGKLEYSYVEKYTPAIELQLLRGGYRLARLLNEIYQ